MKSPACGFKNPPETRYCLRCGKALVPPVPIQQTPPRPRRGISMGLVITLCVIGAMMTTVAIGIVLSFPFRSSRAAQIETAAIEESSDNYFVSFDALHHPIFSSEEDEKYFRQFINPDARLLRLPESEITVTLPDMSDFYFRYDEVTRMLIMEFTTPDGISVSITSSAMDTTPYTRSELEEFKKSGLYTNIEGSQTQYYYQIAGQAPASDDAAEKMISRSAAVIDCQSSRSTNFLVSAPVDGADGQELLDTMLESTGLHS